ncbi:MAG: 16S rRNA (adenine(1518)-N(6)/adenine(1519)-N(6))-dimethyltransferase RsmA [Gammaproteobacteria bacterium]
MSSHTPRKRFGQNFLHDHSVIARIVQAINPQPGQHLVEIGPGQGALTEPLLAALGQLDAIELDRDLIGLLTTKFAARGLRLHAMDALKADFCALAEAGEHLRIVGNLPYNISTPLLFHLFEQKACVSDMHFMLQKEVVQRMAAGPGSKTYGRLSVMAQYHCQISPLFVVKPGAFFPAPKVDSMIVRLRPHPQPPVEMEQPQLLATVVGQAFSQRRKTLRNSVKSLLDEDAIRQCDIDPGIRPEQLSLAQFACLTNRLAQDVTPIG